MKRLRMGLVTLLLATAIGMTADIAAQGPVPPPSQPEFVTTQFFGRPVIRVGQDYTLRAGDTVREVTVIFGNATIEGHVEGDAVAVWQRRARRPRSCGSFVVMRSATVAPGPGSTSVVVIGGGFDAPAALRPADNMWWSARRCSAGGFMPSSPG